MNLLLELCGAFPWELVFNIGDLMCGGKPTCAGMRTFYYMCGTKPYAPVEPPIPNKPDMGARSNGAQCKLTGIEFVLLVELSLPSEQRLSNSIS